MDTGVLAGDYDVTIQGALSSWMRHCLCFAEYLTLCFLWMLEPAMSFGHTIAERQFDASCV